MEEQAIVEKQREHNRQKGRRHRKCYRLEEKLIGSTFLSQECRSGFSEPATQVAFKNIQQQVKKNWTRPIILQAPHSF